MKLLFGIKQARLWRSEIEVMGRKGFPKNASDIEAMVDILSSVDGLAAQECGATSGLTRLEERNAIKAYLVGNSNVRLIDYEKP